ncbi:tRNA 2-thiouridine(34) synthase MnmA [Corticibacter populi]|uniref:tRNA-specific 2-thiouridylase MnmA n=1 Tax=Corticibacter populi TaxID=1550736 RepID=A0A3M6QSQ9_9BURK|nr:tRNA 2-thiouridine(34) synthase MnmA [Corticibacter populi]RMX06033.1 tRNA 2-thiouridine(34) synthase MnmA [Corticibacter populi]RZS30965.1 tRNA (5-methylaminomethyl-2-thiouridylate)-methyltransferase [Corticibacter populi]
MANKHRIVVGLSGGVDSAVSAWLLKQAGHEVVGIFMKNWEDDDDNEYCSSRQDFLDAAAVADVIGIEIEHVNFAAEYKDRVFAEFLREYQAGRTPNPDVLCNAEIKFKAFLDHAMRLGAERIATGHYARARFDAASGLHQLLKGVDPGKDQSYFLHRLSQAQLSKTLFPVGEIHKREVRRIAEEIGLPNARKKDSTGICFIGERPFREFLSRYIAHQPGAILDEKGRQIGRHVGLSFYTLGQRQGLGIGGIKDKGAPRGGGEHQPWFVAAKDIQRNTLHVVQGHDHPDLLSHRLRAGQPSWIAGAAPLPGTYAAKTRYRQADAACALAFDGEAGDFTLDFDQAQWAVTPGQSAVLYDGEVCLGGGIIEAVPVPVPVPVRQQEALAVPAGG